jgi:transposase InsO family protein
METDASNFAYGAILSQKQSTGKRHPVAYMSKSMTPAEKNYDIGDKEALVIVKPLQHWRHWLEGTTLPIEIITDHKNLVNFSKPQILNQRQMRWLHALQRYNFVIGYRPGAQNSAADALSRRQDLTSNEDERVPQTLLSPQQFVDLNAIAADSMTAVFLDAIATDSEILREIQQANGEMEQTKNGRTLVPDVADIKRKILQLYHDAPMAGHPGMTGTYELASRLYTWPKMKEYVDHYVRGCAICARAKKKNIREQGKLQPLPNPMTPWHWTESDLIGPLPKSKGKDAIYVVVDRFTKYAYFVPCNTTETAQSLAQLHAKYVWAHKGMPQIHSTDRGPQFKAEYTKELYRRLGIEQRLSTAYHPQSQGQVENLNGWLETYLRMFIGHRQDDWVDHLHTAQFAWNNHYHASIGTTPFYASRVRHPQTTDVPPRTEDLRTRQEHRKATNELVAHMIDKAHQAQKRAYDRWKNDAPQLRPGDRVWLETTHLSTDRPSPKLDWKRIGPLKILERLGPLTYRVELPATYKIHNVFHISLLTPVRDDRIPGCAQPAPDPITITQKGDASGSEVTEQHYIMERYVDSRWIRDPNSNWRFQFRVKWDGYDDLTWEDRATLDEDAAKEDQQYLRPGDDDFDMEREFYEKHPDAPRHDDPAADWTDALSERRTLHRRKGKAPIWRRRS